MFRRSNFEELRQTFSEFRQKNEEQCKKLELIDKEFRVSWCARLGSYDSKIGGMKCRLLQINNLDNYLDPVLRTFFVCQQLLLILLYRLGCANICGAIGLYPKTQFKVGIGSTDGDMKLFNPFSIYSFTLIVIYVNTSVCVFVCVCTEGSF